MPSFRYEFDEAPVVLKFDEHTKQMIILGLQAGYCDIKFGDHKDWHPDFLYLETWACSDDGDMTVGDEVLIEGQQFDAVYHWLKKHHWTQIEDRIAEYQSAADDREGDRENEMAEALELENAA